MSGTPRPGAQSLTPDNVDTIDLQLSRAIFTDNDQVNFIESKTFLDIIKFVGLLNDAAHNNKIIDNEKDDSSANESPVIKELSTILDALYGWINEFPPLEQPMRFGNKSFRDWHGRLVHEAARMISALVETAENMSQSIDKSANAVVCTTCKSFKESAGSHVIELVSQDIDVSIIEAELCAYLSDSFGNATRIDYGTGHETNFILFLLCLYKIQALRPNDFPSIVLKVFPRYLRVARRLQQEYVLEPAGSHGVWSLDDYQMLVFLFGSSQLDGQQSISPSDIHNSATLEQYKTDYLYLGAIDFICQVKSGGPFAEHSPILNDISGLPTWHHVNLGMQRMYIGEVLQKRPITQHILFGEMLPAPWNTTSQAGQMRSTNPSQCQTGIAGVAPWARARSDSLKSIPGQEENSTGRNRSESLASNTTDLAEREPPGLNEETLPSGGIRAVAPWASQVELTDETPQKAARESLQHSSRSDRRRSLGSFSEIDGSE